MIEYIDNGFNTKFTNRLKFTFFLVMIIRTLSLKDVIFIRSTKE